MSGGGEWKPGDLCRLVNLREGKVYDDGVIDTVKGRKATVIAGGTRWFVELPSSFLQERPTTDDGAPAVVSENQT